MTKGIVVNDRYMVKMLERALRLYTVSLSERKMAEFLADKCDDLGFEDIRIDDVGNIIAKKGAGTPRVMLCGHMDTVPGRIPVRREGDKLYGRGASDAKAPLMAMLFAASAAADEGSGQITFVGAVDEEGNATGIKSLIKNDSIDADYAIFGEPSGLKQVTIAYKGRLAISLRVNVGNSAHASAPWLSKNAIEESAAFISRLRSVLEAGNEGKKRSMMLTATVTEIRGGTSHNVIPQECETVMDIRIPVGTTCQQVEESVSACVSQISAERQTEAFHSILDETEPFEAAHDSALVRAFMLGMMEVEGTRAMLIRKTGTGDMNMVGNRLGIPVVTWGPGDPHLAHTADECVSVSEYMRAIKVLQAALRRLKALDDRGRR